MVGRRGVATATALAANLAAWCGGSGAMAQEQALPLCGGAVVAQRHGRPRHRRQHVRARQRPRDPPHRDRSPPGRRRGGTAATAAPEALIGGNAGVLRGARRRGGVRPKRDARGGASPVSPTASATAPAPGNFSAAKTPRGRPSLDCGPIRTMRCSPPRPRPTYWRGARPARAGGGPSDLRTRKRGQHIREFRAALVRGLQRYGPETK